MANKRRAHTNKKLPPAVRNSLALLLVLGLGMLYLIKTISDQSSSAQETQQVSSQNQITQAFIQEIGSSAAAIAQEHDLYASVMIAQAILESSSGRSGLSQAPSYNLFGIKGDYNGQSVTMQTWEDDGSGNTYTIDASFRAYANRSESLEDYANLLDRPLYQAVHKSQTNSYQDATAALTGTYATDTSYGSKLNAIIERYNLTSYDK